MLKERADLRSVAFVVTYFVLIGAVYLEPISLDGLPSWARGLAIGGLVVTLSLLSFFCAVITHNTIHAPVFHSKRLNKIFQVALTLSYGHPVSMFVPGHNLSHHRYTQTSKDLMRTTRFRFRWNLLNQLLFSTLVGPPIMRSNLEYARAMRTQRPKWYRQLLVETAFYVGFLVLALALDWQKFLLFVLIPHQYAVFGITGINFVQHDGCDPEHPHNHSRNFTGKLVNWFTFNNGYHGIHHMHPSLHWSKAPEVHARELTPFIHPALEQRSLLAYLWTAYVWPGKRLRYDGAPVVLPPPVDDEAWFKQTETFDPADLGAVAQG